MSALPLPVQRFAIELQPFAGADWRDSGLRVDAIDSDAAIAVARHEFPEGVGLWANLERQQYAGGRIGHRIVTA